LTRDYWYDVGIRLDLKEVSSDEYRAAGNNNDLEITAWKNDGTSGPSVSQDFTPMVPPFGDYFNPGTGFAWAAWKSSGGKDGIEPPEDVQRLYGLAEKFIQVPIGSPESDKLGKQIVQIHIDNLWKIGTCGEVINPIMYSKQLGNYKKFAAKTYDFYWTYPYRPTQWFLK
jgi:peptide/nickel transport system substrate-binding protein